MLEVTEGRRALLLLREDPPHCRRVVLAQCTLRGRLASPRASANQTLFRPSGFENELPILSHWCREPPTLVADGRQVFVRAIEEGMLHDAHSARGARLGPADGPTAPPVG